MGVVKFDKCYSSFQRGISVSNYILSSLHRKCECISINKENNDKNYHDCYYHIPLKYKYIILYYIM